MIESLREDVEEQLRVKTYNGWETKELIDCLETLVSIQRILSDLLDDRLSKNTEEIKSEINKNEEPSPEPITQINPNTFRIEKVDLVVPQHDCVKVYFKGQNKAEKIDFRGTILLPHKEYFGLSSEEVTNYIADKTD